MKTEINHSAREHARCSASGAERGLACLGSVAMCETLPPSESSAYAKEGTEAHELCEKILKPLIFHWNKTGEAHPKISEMMDFVIFEEKGFSRAMWEHCKDYADLIWANVETYKPKKVFVEERLYLHQDPSNPDNDMFGTSDCLFGHRAKLQRTENAEGNVLQIWDFKYGAGKLVEASSPQLPYYGVCGKLRFPKVKISEYWLNIFQPRAEHEDGTHRQVVLTAKEIEDWQMKFLLWGNLAQELIGKPRKEIEKHLFAGEHCRWCTGQIVCPAFAEHINTQAAIDFQDDPAVLLPVKEEQESHVRRLLDSDIGRVAEMLKVANSKEIEKFFSMLKQVSINHILAGGIIPGWKVVTGRSIRQLDKTKNPAAVLIKAGIADPYERSLRGIGSLEKELVEIKLKELEKIGVKKKKKEINAEVDEVFARITQKSIPPYVLVSEDDPRPAANGNEKAELDFEVIDVESEQLNT